MGFVIGGGGGKGGGLTVRNSHIFANDTDRDTYFTNNPSQRTLDMHITVAGKLQKNINNTWTEVTPVITGPTGSDAPLLKVEYSADGLDDWSPVLNTYVHKYWRWSTDNGSTWWPIPPETAKYNASSGGSGSGVPEPYELKISATGKLQLWKNTTLVQEQDETGTWITQSVSTGTGSFHIGDLHSNGSAGENVVWLNTQSNIAWYPAWQGVNKFDGTSYELTTRKSGNIVAVEPLGAAQATGSVDYNDTIVTVANTVFFKIDIVPAEDYKGKIVWQSTFLPSSTEVASFLSDVDLTQGVLHTVYLKYPLYALANQQINVKILKHNGEILKSRPSAGNGSKPYRKVYAAPFVDHLVYNQSNNALVARGLEGLAEADALDVLKLKNVGLLSKGNYRGDVPTALSGFTGALKGDWWKASVQRTVGGVTFEIGDELYCTTNTPTLPTDLTNFAVVRNVNQVMQASTQTVNGQAGIVPTPQAGDVKVLTNRGWGVPEYKDSTTNKKYILVIENGLPYLEETT